MAVDQPYSPLELISHKPEDTVEQADIELWNACLKKAEEQIRSVENFLPSEDRDAIKGLFEECRKVSSPQNIRASLDLINRWKEALRWSPTRVLDKLGLVDGTLRCIDKPPIGKSTIISGSGNRICGAIGQFVEDLKENRLVEEVFYGYAADDDQMDRTKPRLLWMAIWGKKEPSSPWPPVGGSKIMSGTNRLKGTLACYSITLKGSQFRADLLPGSSELSTPCTEFAQIQICMEANRLLTEAQIGFAFVLQGYPKKET